MAGITEQICKVIIEGIGAPDAVTLSFICLKRGLVLIISCRGVPDIIGCEPVEPIVIVDIAVKACLCTEHKAVKYLPCETAAKVEPLPELLPVIIPYVVKRVGHAG